MKRGLIVTIDGPAGSGKSTVAKRLAHRLGFAYLDTGAIYRAITLKALSSGILPGQPGRLNRMINQTRIVFRSINNQPRVVMDDQDVTKLIRESWVTDNVFLYAELKLVRRVMMGFQRRFGAKGKIVAEGRDMGSVIFPGAEIKFYLDAGPAVRARRRFKELSGRDSSLGHQQVLKDLRARDQRDKTRKLAPLKKTRDAICVDTTRLNVKQVVNKLLRIVKDLSADRFV